jgi:hypothetical protein
MERFDDKSFLQSIEYPVVFLVYINRRISMNTSIHDDSSTGQIKKDDQSI